MYYVQPIACCLLLVVSFPMHQWGGKGVKSLSFISGKTTSADGDQQLSFRLVTGLEYSPTMFKGYG